MYTCSHCKRKFNDVPYVCCTNSKKYCSLECFPERGMDRPYCFEYLNLIEGIRDIESRINDIEFIEDRIELENDVSELTLDYIRETYGDNEGLYYKIQIEHLISTLDDLYDKIHDVLIQRKPTQKHGVIIDQVELERIVGEEILGSALDELGDRISYSLFENLFNAEPTDRFDNEFGCSIKLSFPTLKESKEVKRFFEKTINKYSKQLTEEQIEILNESSYIFLVNFWQCPVCHEWEDSVDFTFDNNLNSLKCNQWSKCFDFEENCSDE